MKFRRLNLRNFQISCDQIWKFEMFLGLQCLLSKLLSLLLKIDQWLVLRRPSNFSWKWNLFFLSRLFWALRFREYFRVMILRVVTPVGPFANLGDFTFDVNSKLRNLVCFFLKAINPSPLSARGPFGGTFCDALRHRYVWRYWTWQYFCVVSLFLCWFHPKSRLNFCFV